MIKLGYNFYNRTSVVTIARELLGKILISQWQGVTTSGRIVETEAYNGVIDKASHAWNGRRTPRTEVMYKEAGTGYVYLCYGIHHLFNVVTNAAHTPHAVLIRALEPLEGVDQMLKRTNKTKPDRTLTSGPGNVAKALGIATLHSGISLLDSEVFIADDGYRVPKKNILATPRIGVDYAGEDALLPYRFIIKNSPYVSGGKKRNEGTGE